LFIVRGRKPVPQLWTEDYKQCEAGGDDANNDVDQQRAGEACSFFGWKALRFHVGLDAKFCALERFFLRTVEPLFLQGFLRKYGRRMWFFDGEFVVGCW
jgi:hypothetical protein